MNDNSRSAPSCTSYSASVHSRSSTRSATYSHLLYKPEGDMTSKFSSNSTSPNSSEESLEHSGSESHGSTTPSSIHSSVPVKSASVAVATIHVPKYVDTHYPLITHTSPPPASSLTQIDHSALSMARTMVLIHNTIIRAFNSAYNHALLVSPQANLQRTRDFLTFCQTIYAFIEHHHQTEEEMFFPAIEALIEHPGAMDENVKGHELFMPGLDAWGIYINDPVTVSQYSGKEMRRLLESFAPELIEHLHDEIRTLSHLAADPKCPSKAFQKIMDDAEKFANKDADLFTVGPFLLGCQDREFRIDGVRDEKAWPPMPWPAVQLIKRYMSRRHRGAWDFCPSTFDGKRKMM